MICVSQATAKVHIFILLFANIILQPKKVETQKPLELKFANFLQSQTENSKTQLTPAVRSRHYLAQQRPLALKFFQDHHRDCNHCVVLRPNGSN